MSRTIDDGPRGLRNNNPGNIKISNAPWQGRSQSRTDPVFEVFETPVDGIRALAKVLLTYHDKRRAEDGSRIDTLREIIDRWAPPTENHTKGYLECVANWTRFAPDDELDLHRHDVMAPLVKAIIRFENGFNPYTDAEIDAALARVAILPERPKSLQASRTVKGAQAAGAGGIIAATTGAIAAAEPAIPVLRSIADLTREHPFAILVGVGVMALVGAVYVTYAKWDERRRGIA